ncbi:hypothetical protein V8C44DRAFT_318271 [Trichoderma aethiopicum]
MMRLKLCLKLSFFMHWACGKPFLHLIRSATCFCLAPQRMKRAREAIWHIACGLQICHVVCHESLCISLLASISQQVRP